MSGMNVECEFELFLVRHGETQFNQTQRLQGWADSPLTEKGEAVAKSLGEKLKKANIQFQSAFCSTLARTKSTAELVLQSANQADLPIKPLADLREYHFGSFEGKPASELYQAIIRARGLPDEKTWLHEYRHGDYNKTAETLITLDSEAESEAEFVGRLWRGLNEVIDCSKKQQSQQSQSNPKRILVVTHGMAIVAILKSLDKSAILYKSPPNASVSRLKFTPNEQGGKWEILSVGEVDFS